MKTFYNVDYHVKKARNKFIGKSPEMAKYISTGQRPVIEIVRLNMAHLQKQIEIEYLHATEYGN